MLFLTLWCHRRPDVGCRSDQQRRTCAERTRRSGCGALPRGRHERVRGVRKALTLRGLAGANCDRTGRVRRCVETSQRCRADDRHHHRAWSGDAGQRDDALARSTPIATRAPPGALEAPRMAAICSTVSKPFPATTVNPNGRRLTRPGVRSVWRPTGTAGNRKGTRGGIVSMRRTAPGPGASMTPRAASPPSRGGRGRISWM